MKRQATHPVVAPAPLASRAVPACETRRRGGRAAAYRARAARDAGANGACAALVGRAAARGLAYLGGGPALARLAATWLLLALVGAGWPAGAHAGTYTISDCPAAGSNDPGPWNVTGGNQGAQLTCSGPGGFVAPLGQQMSPGSEAVIYATAPAGVTIQAATVWWAVPASSSGATIFGEAFDNGGVIAETDTPSSGQPSTWTLDADTTTLTLAAYCSNDDAGAGCTLASGAAPDIQLFGARLVLSSDIPPSATIVGGDLAASATISGTGTLLYDASSTVSGIQTAQLLVDGQVAATASYAGACTDITWAACPLTESAQQLTLDTSGLSDGTHEIALRVIDAAGNAVIVGDHTLTTENRITVSSAPTKLRPSSPPPAPAPTPPPCNGVCDSRPALQRTGPASAALAGARSASRSAVTLTGRLLSHAGAPIAGAQLQLLEQPAAVGLSGRTLAATTTATNGTWSFRAPIGPSRTLTVVYLEHLSDSTSAATLTYREIVSAPVTLRGAHRARIGQRIVFHGDLPGGYIPAGGDLVAMQILYAGQWRTIDLIRTNAGRALRLRLPVRRRPRRRLRLPRTGPGELELPLRPGAQPAPHRDRQMNDSAATRACTWRAAPGSTAATR